jgi:hypothetical protein
MAGDEGNRIFNKLFEDIDKDRVRHRVENLKDEFPALAEDELVRKIIGQEALYCAFTGACTGVLPWPWIILGTAPDMITLLTMESSLILTIANVYGFEPDGKERAMEVLGCLAASAGAVAGTYGIRRLLDKKLSTLVMEKLARRVLTGFASRLSARFIPFLGAIAGAGINYGSVRGVGKIASDYYKKRRGSIY